MPREKDTHLGDKKKTILYMLDILREHSDCNHGLSQAEIANYLLLEYGIELERKAIANNLNYLDYVGYTIKKNKNGVYLAGRPFEDSELRLLIDSVLSSRHISEKQSRELIKKLCKLSSKYFRPKVKHIYTIDEWTKSDNPGLFTNIEVILQAIEDKKKIRFTLNSYGIDKRLHAGQEHIVSPLRLLMKEQRYYLLCVERPDELEPRFEGGPFVRMLAVDLLSNITTTGMKAEKHEISDETYEKLFREHPEMESFFFEEAEYITFVCHQGCIGKVIATFGKNVTISKMPTLDDSGMREMVWLRGNLKEHFIKVTVKTTAFAVRRFVRANAPYAAVLKPESLKRSMHNEHIKQREFERLIDNTIENSEKK